MWLQVKAKVAALVFSMQSGLIACSVLGAPAGSVLGAPAGKEIVVADHYSLEIPLTYSAEQVSNVEDFQLFRISDGSGKVILQAYFGNQPQTNLVAGDGRRIVAGAFHGVIAEEERKGKWFGETLLKIDMDGWPNYMHAKFLSLNADEHRQSILIIKSLKNRDKNIGSD